MTTTTTADRYRAMVPFEARVAPEVLALCRSLHEMDLGCDRPFTGCDLPDHEEDALALNGVPVRLIDWCACGGDHVIDVYHATWVKIPHPNAVVVRW